MFFYFDDLHLQIIESIFPKPSVENSSAPSGLFYHIFPVVLSVVFVFHFAVTLYSYDQYCIVMSLISQL